METNYLLGRSEHKFACYLQRHDLENIFQYFLFPEVALWIYEVSMKLSHLLCNFFHFIHICSHGSLSTHVSQLIPSIPDTRPGKHCVKVFKQTFKQLSSHVL